MRHVLNSIIKSSLFNNHNDQQKIEFLCRDPPHGFGAINTSLSDYLVWVLSYSLSN